MTFLSLSTTKQEVLQRNVSQMKREINTPAGVPGMHHGYLMKQGEKVKAWKQRYFVLRNRRLYYYKSAEDFTSGDLLGCISLSGLRSVSLSDAQDPKHPHALEIQTAQRTYLLSAASHAEAAEWVRILQNILKRSVCFFFLSTPKVLS